ncbi:GNAT family N-acetyltransferase [Microbulbifer sp. CAU 1566]|uniref:GNAT family N-acetyltransferase n=1 Tax=Microbulbifer sp. CAU 1566 TaxID=2933269 RepID=UPI002004C23E|nr:GNAT family N-acetyltransferase [Microbulbifer sp. CAU 1566]MCK7595972.1 GNAT family N-acetyltransferase [Microbulbifer sp. CAU 1566]
MLAQLLTTNAELEAAAKVLLQLRPQYDLESILAQIHKQQALGYLLAGVTEHQHMLCVAGFVVSEKLAWGKHIYVDDLVTCEAHRSKGAGRLLIQWLKQYGKEIGCGQLHLDSGVQRFSAHRFYLREGFDITSHHFATADL